MPESSMFHTDVVTLLPKKERYHSPPTMHHCQILRNFTEDGLRK
jgi:hypothetical protein